MRMLIVALAVLLSGGPVAAQEVAAQEWEAMTGTEITSRLTDQTLTYEGANQIFYKSGRTLYHAGRDSWGYWRVDNDQYCSQWPPGEQWDCYDMDAHTDGKRLRFVASDGSSTEGTLDK